MYRLVVIRSSLCSLQTYLDVDVRSDGVTGGIWLLCNSEMSDSYESERSRVEAEYVP